MNKSNSNAETQSTQSKHTPGPWNADKWAPGYSVSAPDSHYTICNLSDCNNAEANARLIAAAPDLLAALEDLLPWAAQYAETKRTSLHGDIEFLRLTNAKSAIAKARGENS